MGEDRRVSASEIGEILKSARENKSLTIDQVSKQTRIHSSVLTALEEGRCDDMLTHTYVKSFLSKYASFLGLDSKELVRQYTGIRPEVKKEHLEDGVKVTGSMQKTDYSALLSLLKVISVSVVAVVISIFLIKFATGVAKKMWMAKGKASAKIAATKNSSKKKLATSATKTRSNVEQAKPKEQQVSAPKNKPFVLVIKVKSPTMVEVIKDGVLLYKRVLSRGTVETINAREKIALYIAKAEAVELILDGKSQGSPGRGVAKNIVVTSSGIKIR